MAQSAVMQFLEHVDRGDVEREASAIRAELEDLEALLRVIDRRGRYDPPQSAPGADGLRDIGAGNGSANGHMRLSEKRSIALAIMREHPGRWTPRELRDALAARGIDPKAGTPVKNILWQLAKSGEVHASGGGVYEFPALNVSVDNPEGEGRP